MCDEPTEHLRVRIHDQTNVGTVAVGACYKPPDQKGDEAFLR